MIEEEENEKTEKEKLRKKEKVTERA